MSPSPEAGTPEASADDDHARVLEMMGSPQMQRRLEEARAQREKILAEKAATRGPAAQDPKVRLAWDRELGSIGVVGALAPVPEEAPALPWLDEPSDPVPPTAPAGVQLVAKRGWLGSRTAGVALGLVAGVVLGSGLMWLAEIRQSDLGEAPAAVTPDAEGIGAAVVPLAPSALAVAPSLALVDAGAPSRLPSLQAPLGEPLEREAPARVAEAGTGEGGAVEPASAAPVEVASGPMPALPALGAAMGAEVAVAGLTAPVHPGPAPILAASASPDASPPVQDVPDGPSGGLLGLDWTVALHLPPDTSPETLQEAQEALRAVGVGLVVGTGASPFGVAQSEVRFFHGDDASDAARIAQAMGARARDFSAYRPAPPPGSFEVWLAADGSGARLAD